MALLLKHNMTLHSGLKTVVSFYVNLYVPGTKHFSSDVVPTSFRADDEDIEYDSISKENRIEKQRNVSRLNPGHRNILHERMPFDKPQADFHLSVKYRRKMYGRYGSDSGVNPGVMWPTKEDIKERKEYESVAYPFTIQEMVQAELSKKEAEEAQLMQRQKTIGENVKKLNKWIDDLEGRRAKKLEVALVAKAKKDRLVEEVRRHFGYTVDHREEKFQLMLEQKEREERKSAKLERKKMKDEKVMQELMAAAQKSESR